MKKNRFVNVREDKKKKLNEISFLNRTFYLNNITTESNLYKFYKPIKYYLEFRKINNDLLNFKNHHNIITFP